MLKKGTEINPCYVTLSQSQDLFPEDIQEGFDYTEPFRSNVVTNLPSGLSVIVDGVASDQTFLNLEITGTPTTGFTGDVVWGAATEPNMNCTINISDSVLVNGISITSDKDTLDVGDTMQMNAIIMPNEAVNKNIYWEISNDVTASIDIAGNFTALSSGIVTVYATAADGSGVTSEKTITINKSNKQKLGEAKSAAEKYVNDMSVNNDTTSANILNRVKSAIDSNVSAAWRAEPVIVKATTEANGSIKGNILLTYGNESTEISVDKTIGKLPAPAPVKLTIQVGENGSGHQVKDGKDLIFICSGNFKDLAGIYMDGTSVDAGNYTVKDGPTILTLKANYLDTLSVGKHLLKFQYKNNVSAETELTINAQKADPAPQKETAPKTGDTANMLLYGGLLSLSALAGAVLLCKEKKDDEK